MSKILELASQVRQDRIAKDISLLADKRAILFSIIKTAYKNKFPNADWELATDEFFDEQVNSRISGLTKDLLAITSLVSSPSAQSDEYFLGLSNEIEYLTSLVPTKLSEDELRQIIANEELKGIKTIMSYFSSKHKGLYDGRLLSEIAKSIGT